METFAYVVIALITARIIRSIVSPFKPKKGFYLDKHGNIRCRVCRECDHDHAPDACPEQLELF